MYALCSWLFLLQSSMQLGGIFGFVSVPRGAYVVKSAAQSMLHMVELHAEPEGGEEMAQLKKVTGMRMKNMGPVQGVTGKSGGQAYNFWMTAIAPGELVKEIRSKITKDASKNANFPGFRKVSKVANFQRASYITSISLLCNEFAG